MTAEVDIESHDLRTAGDDVLTEVHALEAAFEKESRPDEPPVPFESYAARYRGMPSFRDASAWVATSGGATAGAVTVDFDRTGSNAHIIEAFAVVKPELRQQGIGSALLRHVVEAADADGRSLLMVYTSSGVPAGAAVMERLGAAAGLVERLSELHLGRLDRSMVHRWVEEGPARAPDYEILMIEGDLPEELLEPFAALYDVSNTAPRDALEMEDEHRTPEQIRESERSRRESGMERILCLARHRESSALAGWTELARHPAESWRVHQYWTAVHPDHRGHGLGKWLKAANIERAVERWPEAEKVVTGNAYSNDAMLGINNQLGFEECEAWTVWQVPVDDVRKYLVSSEAS